MPNKTINISITAGSVVKVLLVLAVAVTLYYLQHLVLLLLTAVVIASAVGPAVRYLSHFKLPRVVSVLIIYILAFVIIGGVLYFFVPPIFTDLSEIVATLPLQINTFMSTNPAWQTLVSFAGLSDKFSIQDILNQGISKAPIPQNFFDTIKALFYGIFDFVFVIVVSFYLAVQKDGIENFLRVVTPVKQESHIISLWKRTEVKIGRWMQGQLILALIIGPLVYLGLVLFQIKYALILAIIAALFELIPFFGPTLSAVPSVILGFSNSVTLGLIIIGFYVIVQQFENNLIYPLVVKKIIGINPLVAIISLVVGVELYGFLGVILAVPAATFLMELLADLEKRKQVPSEAEIG